MDNYTKNTKYKKIRNFMEPKSVQLFKTNNKSSWFILSILSSTLLAVMFSETMLLPAIPEIMNDFNIPYNTAIWVFSAYLIVAAVMTWIGLLIGRNVKSYLGGYSEAIGGSILFSLGMKLLFPL